MNAGPINECISILPPEFREKEWRWAKCLHIKGRWVNGRGPGCGTLARIDQGEPACVAQKTEIQKLWICEIIWMLEQEYCQVRVMADDFSFQAIHVDHSGNDIAVLGAQGPGPVFGVTVFWVAMSVGRERGKSCKG